MRLGELLGLEVERHRAGTGSSSELSTRKVTIQTRQRPEQSPEGGHCLTRLEAALKEFAHCPKKRGRQDRIGYTAHLHLPASDKKLIEQNHIRRIFKRVLTKAGIREMRIHDIRHTYASLLLKPG